MNPAPGPPGSRTLRRLVDVAAGRAEADLVLTGGSLVNVFTVSPEKQSELAELLVRASEETMRHLPGFISASIHRSVDGTKVVNYAQWESREALETMLGRPEVQAHLQEAQAIATFQPIICEVVSVHHAQYRPDRAAAS